jgi:hypothetical protein
MTIEKSKKDLENSSNLQIKARIAVLESELRKSGNQLGLDAKLGNGTVDGWTDKHLDKSKPLVEKFLRHHKVNPQWWETGKGEVFLTLMPKSTDNKENPAFREGVYQTIIEGHTEYVMIPRTVLENTQLVAKDELDRKNKQIDFYQEHFAKLLNDLELVPKPANSR